MNKTTLNAAINSGVSLSALQHNKQLNFKNKQNGKQTTSSKPTKSN